MKGQKRKQSGITLIALVITIIVLLILAGVSINLVLGENGILDKAQGAAEANKKATVLEEAQMVLADWQTDKIVKNISYEGRTAKTNSGADVIASGNQITVVDSKEGRAYTAPFINGVLGEFTEVTNDTNSQVYKAMHPKIPTGYEYVTGEWNTGYVIKETLTGDEFVWVPVVSPASYAKKSGSKNTNMSQQGGIDNGKDVVSLYVAGDNYGTNAWITSKEAEASTVNNIGGFYVSRYEIGKDNTTREARLTKIDTTNVDTVTAKSQSGIEPIRYVTQEAAVEIANNWKSVTNEVQSGLITGTQWDVMCNFIGWSICDSDCTTWGNYYNVASQATGDIWHSGIDAGTGDGVYYWNNANTTKPASNQTSSRLVFATGKFVNLNGGKTDKKKIFDVAGNVWEWTTETINIDASKRVLRGGSTNDDGDFVLATFRTGSNSVSDAGWGVGFRTVLYVK